MSGGVWQNLRLRQRFMIVVGLGVIAMAAVIVIFIARFEEQALEGMVLKMNLL